MATFNVEVKFPNKAQLDAKLRRVGQSVNDFSREMRASGEYLKNFYSNEVFSSRGSVYGEQWAPLASGGPATLVDTGRMKGSFTYRSNPMYMSLTNPTPYLPYHQFGTKKMPKRVVMKVDAARIAKISEIFTKGLERRLRTAWSG